MVAVVCVYAIGYPNSNAILDLQNSQASVSTHSRLGPMAVGYLIIRVLGNVLVKEFRKSLCICRSYVIAMISSYSVFFSVMLVVYSLGRGHSAPLITFRR